MSDRIDKILSICLDAIERGEMTPEECLEKFPQQREELSDLLRAAGSMREFESHVSQAISPNPFFRQSARSRLLSRLPERKPVTFWERLRHIGQNRKLLPERRMTMVWILVVALAATVFGGGGVAYASTGSLPGDALYSVKNAMEEVQLWFNNDQADMQLQLQFAGLRLDEIQALMAHNRYGDVPEALSGFQNALDSFNKVSQKDAVSNFGEYEAQLGKLLGDRDRLVDRLRDMLDQDPAALPDQTKLQIRDMLKIMDQLHDRDYLDMEGSELELDQDQYQDQYQDQEQEQEQNQEQEQEQYQNQEQEQEQYQDQEHDQQQNEEQYQNQEQEQQQNQEQDQSQQTNSPDDSGQPESDGSQYYQPNSESGSGRN